MRMECCSDECRANQLCDRIWNDNSYRRIVEGYMKLKQKKDSPSVNLEKVASTLCEIKLGKRQVRDNEVALELCAEMFNAGYAEALLKHKL